MYDNVTRPCILVEATQLPTWNDIHGNFLFCISQIIMSRIEVFKKYHSERILNFIQSQQSTLESIRALILISGGRKSREQAK